jgi:branched-chain amino acid aminotransferase
MLKEAQPVHKVWLDGAIVAPEDAKISVFTETAMRGANVYEGMRGYWSDKRQNFFLWHVDTHIRRLFQSMKIMRMTPPYPPAEFAKAIADWARANNFREDVHFRVVSYFGRGNGYRSYRADDIATGAWIAGGPRDHADAVQNGIDVCVSSWRRIRDDIIPARVKVGSNYQNSRLAAVEASVNGYDDVILLTTEGKVAEGAGANLMLVRNGELITPRATDGILDGITRHILMRLYERATGRKAIERAVDRTELYIADEVFFCGSGEEITPIVSIDRIAIGDGKVGKTTRELQKLFFDAVRGDDEQYESHLTPIY